MEEVEEVGSVFRELFKVLPGWEKVGSEVTLPRVEVCSACARYLIDHTQRALKHGVKDLGDFSCDVDAQLVYDGCHGAEDLRLPGSRDVPLVVDEHRLQQGGHKVLRHL